MYAKIEHEFFTDNEIIIVEFYGSCYRVDEGFHHEFGYHVKMVTHCDCIEWNRLEHTPDQNAAIRRELNENEHIIKLKIEEQFDYENN